MRDGWALTRIGDLLTIQNGFAFDSKNFSDSKGMPLIRIRDLKDGRFTETKYSGSFDKRYIVKAGDFLIGMDGEFGCYEWKGDDALLNQRVCRLQNFSEKLEPRFLFYEINRHLKEIEDATTYTTVKHLSSKQISNIQVLIPSVSEQQRIVGILDEAFAGLATATGNAEKNLRNSRALFDSYLNSLFIQKGGEWTEKPLIELCSLFVDSAHRTPKYQAEGIPALRPRDVVNGILSLSEAACVSEQEYEIQSRRHEPAPGDVVYSRELSYGWAVALPQSPRVCLSQGMCLFRPKADVETSFLLYVLNGPIGRKQAIRAAVGAAHPHINLGDIKGYRIPVPSLVEQRQIAGQLDHFSQKIKRLELCYQDKLQSLSDLKQFILRKAFSGGLTSTQSSNNIKEAAE